LFRYYYGRRRPVFYTVLGIIFVVVIILITTISVRYTSDYDDKLLYAGTDTRIIPVNNALCQGLKLSVNQAQDGYRATLSLLDSRPPLNRSQTFDISDVKSLGYNDYEFYYYYMYPGSNFTVSACIDNGHSTYATFNMIKGDKKFRQWIEEPFRSNSFQINTQCSSGRNNSHYYRVTAEDYYYLIFDAEYRPGTVLSVHMDFYRTLYQVDHNVSANDSCSVETGDQGASCTISIPLSGKTAFLEVAPVSNTFDWAEGIDLDTKCVPREWMYVMIALSILVGVAAILVALLVCIVIMLRSRKSKPASTVASVPADSDNTPLVTAPPPSNPDYQEPPPAYGSNNYTAPPEYKA
jgi:preprotein translocase subunit SecG